MQKIIIKLIRSYKHSLSPFLATMIGGGCRFEPTCSEYACGSIQKHGLMKGSFHSIKRIIRCNPLSKPGFDPVK